VLDQIVRGRAGAVVQNNACLDSLAPRWIRHRDHRNFGNRWMVAQRFLDLPGIDVFAA
jgi:hypothetical protein